MLSLLPSFLINDYSYILFTIRVGVDDVLYHTYQQIFINIIFSVILLNSKYYMQINKLRISFTGYLSELRYKIIKLSFLKNKYSIHFILLAIFISWLFMQTISTYLGGNRVITILDLFHSLSYYHVL